MQFAYRFVTVKQEMDISWKYLIMAASSVRFLATIYWLTANDTITTVPTPTGTSKLKYYSKITIHCIYVLFSPDDEQTSGARMTSVVENATVRDAHITVVTDEPYLT